VSPTKGTDGAGGPSRRRQLITTLAVVVAVVAVAAVSIVATGGAGREPALSAAHATTAAPPPPGLTGSGPSSGNLVADWSTTMVTGGSETFAIAGGELLAESPQGIDAYDAATGTRRWYLHALRPDTAAWRYRVTGSTVTIDRADTSAESSLRTALDLTSGRVLSNRRIPDTEAAPATPPAGDRLGGVRIGRSADGRTNVTGPGGRVIATLPASFSSDGLLSARASGDFVLIPGENAKTDEYFLAVVNTRTGRTRVHRTAIMRALATDGRRAYSVIGNIGSGSGAPIAAPAVESALLPAAVQVTDLADGTVQRLPLPVPGGSSLTGPERYPFWIGAAGGRLFVAVASQESRARIELMSVSVGGTAKPLSLGGVPARSWPDPCRLAHGYRTVANHLDPGGLRLGDASLPRVGCTFIASRGEGVTVTVGWLSRTAREAQILMAGLVGGLPQQAGDQAVTYPGTRGAGASTVMRVGRTIVIFQASHHPAPPDAAARKLMNAVAATLRGS
jgi:hypothetical protein